MLEEEATSFRERCASSGSKRRLGMYQGEYCEPLIEFATYFFMICPRSSPPSTDIVVHPMVKVGRRLTPPDGEALSPVAATATPVSSAAEHQQKYDDNQDQLHRHGNLQPEICVRTCCLKAAAQQ